MWWIRLSLPESPRWLAEHGRLAEAEAVMAALEERVAAQAGGAMEAPRPAPVAAPADGATSSFSEMWRAPYSRRVLMLAVFNIFQAIGFYGFGNWVPQLLASQGASFAKSLEYSFIIAIVYPLGPLVCSVFADRLERKWQICLAALGTAVFGLLFAQQSTALGLIVLGVLITTSNNLLSFSYHAYQAELFPTRIRARAVGFVYSFSRLSTVFTSFMIAFFLQNYGAPGVFVVHRLRDADGDPVDRHLRPEDQQPPARGDLDGVSGRIARRPARRSRPGTRSHRSFATRV